MRRYAISHPSITDALESSESCYDVRYHRRRRELILAIQRQVVFQDKDFHGVFSLDGCSCLRLLSTAFLYRIFLEYRRSLSQSQVFRGYKREAQLRKLLY